MSVRPCVCLFTFELPVKGLFAPTSWSWMSKIFRDSESLGKSNGKKRSQIWKLLQRKGLKLQRKKKFVAGQILPYWAGFFWYRCYYPYWLKDSLSSVCGIFFILFWVKIGQLIRYMYLKRPNCPLKRHSKYNFVIPHCLTPNPYSHFIIIS